MHDGWMKECVDECMCGWMHGCMDAWMNGRKDGWMEQENQ